MKRLMAVIVLLCVTEVGRAGEKEILKRLEEAGAAIRITSSEEISVELGPEIVEACLPVLCELPHLRWLTLHQRGLTDAQLRTVCDLSWLLGLCLNECPVTDAQLKQVARLSKLKWLSLFGTRVTKEGIGELAGLKNLKCLILNGNALTDADVARLQKSLPECMIHY